MRNRPRPENARQRGFTRTDLMVVLAMCCVLVPLLTLASQRGDEDIRRAQCRNNLRQIGVWLTAYAGDNDNALPRGSVGGWPHDLNRNHADSATSYGVQPNSFYCPSGVAAGAGDNWSFDPDFRVVGYVLAMARTPRLVRTNLNASIIPQPVDLGRGNFIYPTAADRELAADSTLSNGVDRWTAQFTGIYGGSANPHRANHVTDTRPDGGNILYLDGHVEWRNFSEMTVRTAGSPSFWY
jgi:prepilin-type processing-associated H-X9-DG protein